MMTAFAPYRGRFAPSPTGPLHFGSLVAALASYLDARSQGGEWLIRIEDLDTPREVPGAADQILRTLEAFGLGWDGEVLYQSRRLDAYRAAVEGLIDQAHAYPCACSRGEIAEAGAIGEDGPIYPGTCSNGLPSGRNARALRVRTPTEAISFEDRIQGRLQQQVRTEVGDFVICRADQIFAYQLAVVVDDAWQEITHIVRGADLLLSTPRQIHLQHLLGLPTPVYAHVPVAVDEHGRKLSKQAQDLPVDPRQPVPALLAALHFLNQPLPADAAPDLADLRAWALAHWAIDRVPHHRLLPYTSLP